MTDIPEAAHLSARLRDLRFPARALLFSAAVAVMWLVVAPVAWCASGWDGVGASLAAAVVCWLPALISLGMAEFLRGPYLLAGWLGGMAIRLAVPLACALVVHSRGGWLAEAGLLYYLAALYPLTLLVETLFSLPAVGRTQAAGTQIGD